MKLETTQTIKLNLNDLQKVLVRSLGLPEETRLQGDLGWAGGMRDDYQVLTGVTLTFVKETDLP